MVLSCLDAVKFVPVPDNKSSEKIVILQIYLWHLTYYAFIFLWEKKNTTLFPVMLKCF